MKSLRSTLILLVLAILGGAYLYFGERGAPPREGAVVLLRAPQTEIRRVVLRPSGIVIERANLNQNLSQNWTVRDPKAGLRAALDEAAARDLWAKIELIQSDLAVEHPEKLAQYGLQTPRASMEIDGRKLEFGARSPFDRSLIYACGARQIALVGADLEAATRKPFSQWRDSRVLALKAANIAAFSLQNGTARLRFRKSDAGNWNLQLPQSAQFAAADTETVNGALDALESSKTTKWLDERGQNAARYKLKSAPLRFQAGDLWLEIGAKTAGGYAARSSASGAIFEVSDAVFALLNRPARDWRDKQIARFNLNEVGKLTIEKAGKRAVLVQKGGNWAREGGSADSKSRDAALGLISWVAALRARDFLDEGARNARFMGAKPALSVEIDANSRWKLEFRASKTAVLALVTDEKGLGTLFVLNEDALDGARDAVQPLFERPKL